MTDSISLQPSTDIHLVLDPAFPHRRLSLRVMTHTWNGTEARYEIGTASASHVAFDFWPATFASIVRFDASARTIAPIAPGTVLMQARYWDSSTSAQYHSIVARIQVHRELRSFWFGNDSLSIFRDASRAHGQPSIFALFDDEIVGDISGHGYVALSSSDRSVVDLDTARGGSFTDRLRGIAPGDAMLTGTLGTRTAQLELHVGDLEGGELTPIKVDRTVPRNAQLNLVYLAEGFSGSSTHRTIFDTLTRRLLDQPIFESERNAPFSLLEPRFNRWTHRAQSREGGLTIGLPLVGSDPNSEYLLPLGQEVTVDDGPPDAYTLNELTALVGWPSPADRTIPAADLRARWRGDASLVELGYDDSRVTDSLVFAWTGRMPWGYAQARDTFYGLMQGRRHAEQPSETRARPMLEQPTGSTSPADRRAFAERLHDWYRLTSRADLMYFDRRRFAPELWNAEERFVTKTHLAKLVDPTGTGDDHRVGELLDRDNAPTATTPTLRYGSAGLAVIVTHHTYPGGHAHRSGLAVMNRGRSHEYKVLVETEGGIVRRFRTDLEDFAIDGFLEDLLAHELGHSFFDLGDEYEEVLGPPPQVDTNWRWRSLSAERVDNSVHVSRIQVGSSPDPNFPTPIDPTRLTWARLHRLDKAAMLVAPSSVTGGRITVTLRSREALAFRRLREADSSVRVHLRRNNAFTGALLPIKATDLYENLTIEDVPDDRTVVLGGAPAGADIFPVGSVLFKAKLDERGQELFLIDEPVMTFMRTQHYDSVLPPGRALTENHHGHGGSDPIFKGVDLPPLIPDYEPPCASYRTIGAYEGSFTYTRDVYRPAGACKMRMHGGHYHRVSEYCFVCKYLMVSRVDPAFLPELDRRYYPARRDA